MDALLGLVVGVGLSAACGFRLVIPFLVMSIASLSGHLTLADDMAWIGSYPALIVFGVAAVLEILVYFVPWLDDVMSAIAIPVAIIAGTVITASFVTDMSPLLRWSLAAIAGGTVAGSTEVLTTGLRFASTATTAGLGNGLISIGELISSTLLALLSLLTPWIALILVIFFLMWSFKQATRILSYISHHHSSTNHEHL
ncbi:MAG: DUF4126 domain-containing protein [Leptolyngbyaceae bacterium]|nr:DUF4126 domain-containing protein [Leptolyngbyaceae bacterium]